MQDFSIDAVMRQLDPICRTIQSGELGALSLAQLAQAIGLIALWVLGYKVTSTAGRWTWESVRGPLSLVMLVARIICRTAGTVGGGLLRAPGRLLRVAAWVMQPRPVSELANAILMAIGTKSAWQDDKATDTLHAHKVSVRLGAHPFRVFVDGLDATASLSRREQRLIYREARRRLADVVRLDESRMRREMLRTLQEPPKKLDGGLRRGVASVSWFAREQAEAAPE